MVHNALKSIILPTQVTEGTDNLAMLTQVSDHKSLNPTSLQVLSPKQMLLRLPIALAQVQTDNTPENLLNKMSHDIKKKQLLQQYIKI